MELLLLLSIVFRFGMFFFIRYRIALLALSNKVMHHSEEGCMYSVKESRE